MSGRRCKPSDKQSARRLWRDDGRCIQGCFLGVEPPHAADAHDDRYQGAPAKRDISSRYLKFGDLGKLQGRCCLRCGPADVRHSAPELMDIDGNMER